MGRGEKEKAEVTCQVQNREVLDRVTGNDQETAGSTS